MVKKAECNYLGPFEKGIDFMIHFRGKKFTIDDIKDRYDCSYRQALRLRNRVARMIVLSPAGFSPREKGRDRYLWEISERR